MKSRRSAGQNWLSVGVSKLKPSAVNCWYSIINNRTYASKRCSDGSLCPSEPEFTQGTKAEAILRNIVAKNVHCVSPIVLLRTYANAIWEESGRFGCCKRNREKKGRRGTGTSANRCLLRKSYCTPLMRGLQPPSVKRHFNIMTNLVQNSTPHLLARFLTSLL